VPLVKKFPQMVLSTTILRNPRKKDIEELFCISKDTDVMKYYGMPHITSRNDIKREINWFNKIFRNKEGIRWIIASKETNKYIGDIGFHNYSKKHRRMELGYKLAKVYWRKGIMSESIKRAMIFAFLKIRVNRIEALVDKENRSSIRLLIKLGFKKEGILRQYEKETKGFVDLAMFSILREEFSL
jgi:ribosomal-protein-alanine N-acetyltransferase